MKFLSRLKRFHIGKYELCFLGILLFALVLRFVLLTLNWPLLNSDEGNMGVLVRHIAFNGEWPTFFYGQSYMGPVEGYVSAPLFHLFGSSLFVLRLGLLPFYALFLCCMYGLSILLQTKKFAILMALLFSIGGSNVLYLQLKAFGEYPETELFAAAICLIVVWLALSLPAGPATRRVTLFRLGVYGALGLIIGLAIWVDMLILPFVCMGILFLLLFCRRELFSLAGLSLLSGIIIGLLPLIIYNLQVPFSQGSIAELINLHNGTAAHGRRFLAHVIGTFGVSLPAILSYSPNCQQRTFAFFGRTDISCGVTQILWGIGYLVLWIIAAGVTLHAIWKLWRSRPGAVLLAPNWSFEQRRSMIRECGRLMVLICSISTLLLYLTSSASATTPGPTTRYLIGMLISIPTVLWPLWDGIGSLHVAAPWKKITFRFIRSAFLTLILGMFVYSTCLIFINEVPNAQVTYNKQIETVKRLESLNAKYVYSEYWTCNNLTFLSNEKIICSSVDDHLNPASNRYPPYQIMVASAPNPTYIFPDNSAQAATFERYEADGVFATPYQRSFIDGYVIYAPQIGH